MAIFCSLLSQIDMHASQSKKNPSFYILFLEKHIFFMKILKLTSYFSFVESRLNSWTSEKI